MTPEILRTITRTGRPVLFQNNFPENPKEKFVLATGVDESGELVSCMLMDGTRSEKFFQNLTPAPTVVLVEKEVEKNAEFPAEEEESDESQEESKEVSDEPGEKTKKKKK
ncbi:hypothetical protein [uncultured Sphaerochaeta sp.]|uniref:hypothetical protein n=1 Tax=uncultured Sphaerochaeta sp. TaxID=886478 RepID=UPI0026267E96|nr:hypothetical protein [uncultured Sphaerochaeta sp.]